MSDIREDPMFRQLLQAQKLSRRGFIRGGATFAGAGALAACGTKGTKSSTAGGPTTSTAATGGASTAASAGTATSSAPAPTSAAPTYPDKSATDKKVNWSNWPLYIDIAAKGKNHPTIDAFTKASGIKVTYNEDVNDNDEFFGKIKPQMSSGQDTGRDIITLTDWMAGRLIRLGWVEKLDKTKIPNAGNVIASLATPGFDPTRDYSLPWQSGMTGVAYNSKATGGVKV
ncbi:MAG: spermidine/putrescine transport system substrate-binding protein, partial [Frankiales bacterium]|nr:spermidine/putrescine transport system substrate-binding protein [Frankiales bacterium]